MKAHIVMAIPDALWVETLHEANEPARLLLRKMMTTAAIFKIPTGVDVEYRRAEFLFMGC
jgi:hypothetical protein